jgi:hypothetical protein
VTNNALPGATNQVTVNNSNPGGSPSPVGTTVGGTGTTVIVP